MPTTVSDVAGAEHGTTCYGVFSDHKTSGNLDGSPNDVVEELDGPSSVLTYLFEFLGFKRREEDRRDGKRGEGKKITEVRIFTTQPTN